MGLQNNVNKDQFYQLLMTMQIKNDCITLVALKDILSQPIISLSFLPVYALFAEEIEKSIGENGEVFSISNNSPFKTSSVRSKLKLFGAERLGKSKKIVLSIDELQGEIFRKKLRINITRNLNIHYNLGVFFNEQDKIIGNTQYFYYMFQEKNIDGYEYTKNEVYEFGRTVGTVISSINEGLKDFMPDCTLDIEHKKYRIKFKDYNTNRKSFSSISSFEYGKDITLILLHVLSNINIILYVLDEVLDRGNTYLFKIKYISLYYSVNTLRKILSFLDENKVENQEFERLNRDIKSSMFLMNNTFRNCMMHYKYVIDDIYLIDDQFLNVDIKFFGLVETHFEGKNFFEIHDLLTKKLFCISDTLEMILDLDKKNLKYL